MIRMRCSLAIGTENHGRPDHAVHLAASTVEPGSTPGSHEEPHRAPEHHEAHQRWHHQDAVVLRVRDAVVGLHAFSLSLSGSDSAEVYHQLYLYPAIRMCNPSFFHTL